MKRISDPHSDRLGRQIWHWQVEASDLGNLITLTGAMHISGSPYRTEAKAYRVVLEDIGRFIEVRCEAGESSWRFCEDPTREVLQHMKLLGLLDRQPADDHEINQVKDKARNLAQYL